MEKMQDINWTFNVSKGGQVNVANDNAAMYVEQNNGVSADELDDIVKGIMDNLSGLKKEDAESIKDIVDIANEELSKSDLNKNRLRNCVTLLAPMFTIANGIPTLTGNLQRLIDYIMPFIK